MLEIIRKSACGLYGYKMTFIVFEDNYLKKTQWLFTTKTIQVVLQLKLSRLKLEKIMVISCLDRHMMLD